MLVYQRVLKSPFSWLWTSLVQIQIELHYMFPYVSMRSAAFVSKLGATEPLNSKDLQEMCCFFWVAQLQQSMYIHTSIYIYICIYNHVYCIRSYDLVWFRMIYVCLISYVWMDACMVWYGMAWHGMVWNGMEWYVMLYMCVIIFRDTMDPPMRAIICAAVAWPAINFDALLHQMWCFLNPKNIYTHTYRVSILYL